MNKTFIHGSELYNFEDLQTDIRSLVHLISLHGENLVGLELGVYRAESFCTLLQMCDNIKTLYGIDNWQPYEDYLKDPYDGIPSDICYKREAEYNRMLAMHSIKYSPNGNKAVILEEDSNIAVNKIEDESLDFIFIDTYMTKEQAEQDLITWYPKVKPGGIFAGHDWDVKVIQQVIYQFRDSNNITNKLSTYDRCWVWKK